MNSDRLHGDQGRFEQSQLRPEGTEPTIPGPAIAPLNPGLGETGPPRIPLDALSCALYPMIDRRILGITGHPQPGLRLGQRDRLRRGRFQECEGHG